MSSNAFAEVDEVDTIDDEFFAMIYSDEELLRAEFDALMAAAWPGPPTPARGPGAEHPPDGPRSNRPPVGGRLPRSVGAGRRTLAPRTRAPPNISASRQPLTGSSTRGGLELRRLNLMIPT